MVSKRMKKKAAPPREGSEASATSRPASRASGGAAPAGVKKAAKKAAGKGGVKPAPTGGDAPPPGRSFPIVGIGASAGGLDACKEFFEFLPADTGMAFVLVQHLDPHHKSMLTELLSRIARVPIQEVADGMRVEPDHVYIIPPNTELGILQGVLHLMPRNKASSPPLPIDFFLKSLAADQESMAIGVILSGSASDGTIGLKAIKTAGGITFAQDEASAKYSSMPHSAIAAGCVDFVLTPEYIAKELARIARQPVVLKKIAGVDDVLPDEGGDELNKIFLLLRARTGTDFTYYKHSTIRRRIHRRMVLHKLERLKDYLRYLRDNPAEQDGLFQDILINVTGFFRDPESFDFLQQSVFPRLEKQRPAESPIRIWVAGCSTGEEPYSLAIALLEYLGERASVTTVQIFASDIDDKAISKARAGIYPEGITADVSPARLQRYFNKVPGGYQVTKAVRDMCVFAVQNVAKDPPFSRLDMVCCRNLFIYLSNVLQKKVLQIFHYALKPQGFLLLGSSESISSGPSLFSLMDKKNKVYLKKSIMNMRQFEFTPESSTTARSPDQKEMQHVTSTINEVRDKAERILLDEYAPPSVIINQAMEILQFRGHTGPYIEPVSGSASLNLMKMARADLIMDLRTAVRQAIKEDARVLRENVHMASEAGERRIITLQVVPIKGHMAEDRSYLILFEEKGGNRLAAQQKAQAQAEPRTQDEKDLRITELEQELVTTREYLQTIIEDQETTNEELQSANEEVQSTNEELQSTNEELETAKEELQSTNEELITVNEELVGRNQELTELNNDLTNLLESVQLPIVMLSEDMKIRHFTPSAARLFNVIDSDVGRPISDIKANIDVPDLQQRILKVMDSVMPDMLEVRDTDGIWYNLRIRPYKTSDKRIAGAVLVFLSMGSAVERRLAAVVRDANDAVTLQDFKGNILAWNKSAERVYGYTESEAQAMNIHSLVPDSERSQTQEMIASLQQGGHVGAMETLRMTRAGETVKVWLSATALVAEDGKPYAFVTTEHFLESES
ncbi:MAG: CheR family methyltransferase [Gammaproteobacteria bacterium]|nr:CheR family methyltransferase [Gammaproteobacteria bacterium]